MIVLNTDAFYSRSPSNCFTFYLLAKRLVSVTALVIGSMVPDFEYFIKMRLDGSLGHNMGGVFYFDLPVGLLLYFTYEVVAKDVLIDNLPYYFKTRLTHLKNFKIKKVNLRKTVLIAVCIIVGAASHLLWDSFTHQKGWFTTKIDLLTKVFYLLSKPVAVFKILQHSSTIAGLAVIAYRVVQLPESDDSDGEKWKLFWPTLLSFSLIIFASRMMIGQVRISQYGTAIVSAMSAAILSLTITCLFRFFESRRTFTS